MKVKTTLMLFVVFLFTMATLGIVKSNQAIENSNELKELTSSKTLDSIISRKIDYRYTSYDGKFMYDNIVVIDNDSVIIGRLILYTNPKEVDSFYNSNLDWSKTRLFSNLKNGRLRVMSKKE